MTHRATLPRADGRSVPDERIASTFAGLTAGRCAAIGLVLLLMSLGRPSVLLAMMSGHGFASAAAASLSLNACRFVPTLLLVVAAVNRAPGHGMAKLAWLAGAVVTGEAAGTALTALMLPIVAPFGYLAQIVDLEAPPALRALRWTGIALTETAIAAAIALWWYWYKRNSDAVAAVGEAERAKEQALQATAEAQIMMMKAQIEPHFLFNTLASIRRLFETDPVAGRAMLRNLASYLNAYLPQLRSDVSTLETELALARAYLDVQRIRIGERLAVDIDVPPRLLGTPIPPMILNTLVENAVIHGIAPLSEGGTVAIRARDGGGVLTVEVADDGRGLRDDWGAGVGLANIDARLHAAFGSRAAMTLTSLPGRGVVARVTLPLPGAAPAPP